MVTSHCFCRGNKREANFRVTTIRHDCITPCTFHFLHVLLYTFSSDCMPFSFISICFSARLDNNWSLSMNYLQGKVNSVKGDRGEKVSTPAPPDANITVHVNPGLSLIFISSIFHVTCFFPVVIVLLFCQVVARKMLEQLLLLELQDPPTPPTSLCCQLRLAVSFSPWD